MRKNSQNFLTVLPQEFIPWVEQYNKAGGKRSHVSWLFAASVIRNISPFLNYDKKYQKRVEELKFLCTLLIFIIDDIADRKKDFKLLEKLYRSLTLKGYSNKAKLDKLSQYSVKIYNIIQKEAKKLPFYKEYKEILDFEISQIFNSMKFSALVDKHPYLINTDDFWTYLPCSMQMNLYSILELMSGNKKLTPDGLRKIRVAILLGQRMARIGNWISTWEREIYEKDLTSYIFVYLLDTKMISISELKKLKKKEILGKIRDLDLEERLRKDWKNCYKDLNKKDNCEGILNITDFRKKTKDLLELQLKTKS